MLEASWNLEFYDVSVIGTNYSGTMTRSIWFDLDRDVAGERARADFDVVVVGGGIIGASAAYYLSKRDNLKVAIVESNSIASQASGRNAGFVLRGIQTYYNECVKRFGRDNARFIYEFAEENQAVIKQFASQTNVDFAIEPCGSYILADSIEELEELEESFELLNEDGFEVELIKDDPLDRGFYGALLNKQDFGLNPVSLTRAISQASGAEIFENEHVLRLESDHESGKIEVIGTGTSFFAETVILATNAYTPLVDPWFQDKFKTARGQILITRPLSKRIIDRLCYANYGWVYFRQLSDMRLLLGGRRQLYKDQEVGYADLVTPEVQSALEEYMKDSFADIVGTPIDYRFSGVMAYTKDGLPILGEHPHSDRKRVFYALGFNGHGIGYGMRIGKTLVDYAMEGIDPGLFGANRETLLKESGEANQGP